MSKLKTTLDIKQDMSDLYEALKAGAVDIKVAAELANISGKFLSAEKVELAREVFMRGYANNPEPKNDD